MISKSAKYALRAVLYLASKNDDGVYYKVRTIAREIDAPAAFTAKILQELNRNGIVSSLKGPHGGFFIDRTQQKQPIITIVKIIDGEALFTSCGLGLKSCSEDHPCPLHNDYKEIRGKLVKLFESTSIKKLAEKTADMAVFLT